MIATLSTAAERPREQGRRARIHAARAETPSRNPMSALLNIAVDAAEAAGRIIIRHHQFTDRVAVERKGAHDFVSSVDREAEREIVERLRKAHPEHAILAEEGTAGISSKAEFEWLVDPLDGTTNYLFGFPHYAVSIALRRRGKILLGVVYDPFKQELFTAEDGRGALLDGRRIRARARGGLADALLATGFPFRDGADLDRYIATLRALIPGTAGIRRAGSAALDLAYVAAGRFDGFWEFGLKPWDMAAGIALAREAGVIVKDLGGGEDPLASGDIIAATPRVLEEMLERLEELDE